jgi:hypothetical protein
MGIDSGHDSGGSGLRKEPDSPKGVGLLRGFLRRAPADSVPREVFLDSFRFLVATYSRDVEVYLVRNGRLPRDDARAHRIADEMGKRGAIMGIKAGENPDYKAELTTVSTALNTIVSEANEPSDFKALLKREISRIGQPVDLAGLEAELTRPGKPLSFLRLGRALTTIEKVTEEVLDFNPYIGEPEA